MGHQTQTARPTVAETQSPKRWRVHTSPAGCNGIGAGWAIAAVHFQRAARRMARPKCVYGRVGCGACDDVEVQRPTVSHGFALADTCRGDLGLISTRCGHSLHIVLCVPRKDGCSDRNLGLAWRGGAETRTLCIHFVRCQGEHGCMVLDRFRELARAWLAHPLL